MSTIYIYGITKDDGNHSDPDEAIDTYHYYENDSKYYAGRQYVVNKVKSGSAAYTCPSGVNGVAGAKCYVATSKDGIEYLKSVADGNPYNNISNLPEM